MTLLLVVRRHETLLNQILCRNFSPHSQIVSVFDRSNTPPSNPEVLGTRDTKVSQTVIKIKMDVKQFEIVLKKLSRDWHVPNQDI